METDAATSAQPTVLDGPVATASDPAGDRVPGRFCPHDYALEHDLFAAPAKYRCNCLYVVGGLYGNIPAAKALDELLQNEPEQNRLLVLNGDLHWFDARTADFLAIERLSKQHVALLGNVEAELRRSEDSGAGCGCAYPYELAAEETVERSNAIHQQLKALMEQPGMQTLKDELDERPSVALVEVGGRRVAITHGDERYLAGWQCAREALRSPARQQQLANWADDLKISVLAVTHTCAPVALVLPAAEGNDGNSGKGNDTGGSGGSGGRGGNGGNGGSDDAKVRPAPLDSSAATAVAAATAPKACAIINNGAAGMPNFSGQDFGLVSRIALSTHTQALYRAEVAGVYVEALPLTYNNVAFKRWFNELWPPHSPAALSYQSRIEGRIDDAIPNALLGGFTLV